MNCYSHGCTGENLIPKSNKKVFGNPTTPIFVGFPRWMGLALRQALCIGIWNGSPSHIKQTAQIRIINTCVDIYSSRTIVWYDWNKHVKASLSVVKRKKMSAQTILCWITTVVDTYTHSNTHFTAFLCRPTTSILSWCCAMIMLFYCMVCVGIVFFLLVGTKSFVSSLFVPFVTSSLVPSCCSSLVSNSVELRHVLWIVRSAAIQASDRID